MPFSEERKKKKKLKTIYSNPRLPEGNVQGEDTLLMCTREPSKGNMSELPQSNYQGKITEGKPHQERTGLVKE